MLIQHRNLRFLFFRQLGAPALFKTFDRILSLFYLFANYRNRIGIVKFTIGADFLDGRVFELRL